MRTSHAIAVALLIASACIASSGDEADLLGLNGGGNTVFLVQRNQPTVVMEALFEGRVEADAEGCLRLEGPNPATVVWPFGSRLEGSRVLDSAGHEIGRIGGEFRFGGGEVPSLQAWIAGTAEERGRIEARCPGRYWIVGDVGLLGN